ncbi:MAG: four helix bundle protein [Minisyncoccota bacterium]
MAQYSHLPIYNAAFGLLRELYVRVPKFGKQYKYLLGEKLIGANIDIIRLILEANNTREPARRRMLLEELVWLSESIIILLRIANELKQLGGERRYLYLLEKTVGLSKQAEGWKKSVS